MRHNGHSAPRTRHLIVSGVCLLAVLALPLQAFAGACQTTKRSYSVTPSSWNDGAHTTAHNDTSDARFSMTIDAAVDGQSMAKASKVVAPDDSIGQFIKFSDSIDTSFVDFTVIISDQGGVDSVSCAFRVKYGGSTIWDLAKDAQAVCGDASVLCPTCEISCDKSYHANKYRWNTTFRITK